jgi:hypothetical protein
MDVSASQNEVSEVRLNALVLPIASTPGHSGGAPARVDSAAPSVANGMGHGLDRRVGPGKHEALVAVLIPSNLVGRLPTRSPYFDDLTQTVRLTGMVAVNDNHVSDLCFHRLPPES